MNVRRVDSWEAKDGSLHRSERGALVASVAFALNGQGTSDLPPWTIEDVERSIVPNVDALLILLPRLSDPRNRAAQPSPTPVETAMQDEGDMLLFTDEGVAREVIDRDDLRDGQLVEMIDGSEVVIYALGCDNLPQPVIQPTGEDGGPGTTYLPVDDIVRVLKQPEELMEREEAENTLCALDVRAGNAGLSPLDHKRRILLHRRIEQLEREADVE